MTERQRDGVAAAGRRGTEYSSPDPLSRLTPNALAGVSARVVQMAVSLWMTGFVVRVIGTEQWSVVVLATSTASLLSLIQVGASLGIAKRLTSLAAEDRWEEYERYFTASEALSLILVAILGAAVAVLLGPAWGYLHVSGGGEVRTVVALAAVPVAAAFLQLPSIGALQSAHRVDLIAGTMTRTFLLRSASMVVALLAIAPRAWVYALVAALESVLALLLLRFQVRRVAPRARARATPHLWADLTSIAVFNVALSFNSAIYAAFLQLPVFFLQRLGSLQAVAGYGVLLQVNNAARAFFVAGTNALGPVANAFVTLKDRAQLRALFIRSSEAYLAAALLMCSWLIAFREEVLRLWLGAPSKELVAGMPAFVVAAGIGIAAMPAAVVSTALEELRIPALAGVLLVVAMTLGLTGLRPETALLHANVALVVGFGVYQLVRVATVTYLLDISFRGLMRGAAARATFVALVAAGGLFASRFLPAGLLAKLILGSIAWSALALFSLITVLHADEKRWVHDRARSIARRLLSLHE